jgi:hypothetical protein
LQSNSTPVAAGGVSTGETGVFNKANGAFRHKNETAVQLRLTGQEPVEAFIFHVIGERMTDMLNDPRSFIPVRLAAGEVMIVAKSQIASMVECDIDETSAESDAPAKSPRSSFDPYKTLRVAPNVSDDELRAAFNARIKAVHPDTIASLGLDEDLAEAASKATQKIIYAYRKIMRERGSHKNTSEKSAAQESAQATS